MELGSLRAALVSSHSRSVQVIAPSGGGLSLLARELHETLPDVGVVGQDPYAHISYLRDTVLEEVAIGLEQRGVSPDEMLTRCTRILRLCGLDHLAQHNPAKLSGGQTRRLAIATVAVLEPAMLVLDTPFAGLDPSSIEAIVRLLRSLDSEIIVLGHRPYPQLGSTTLSLIDDSLHPAHPTPEKAQLPPRVPALGEEPIDVGHITASRGGATRKWWQFRQTTSPEFTVGPVHLVATPGEVLWLRGANGSGKTTLLRALAGLDGHDPHPAGVSLALQHAADQVIDSTVAAFVANDDLLHWLVDTTGCDPDEHPLDLPAAHLRLAQLASVIGQNRSVILLDEPDTGLDPTARNHAHELLALALSRGAALIMTCHDESFMDEVAGYSQSAGFSL